MNDCNLSRCSFSLAINHHDNEAQTRRSSLRREGGKNIKEPVENDEGKVIKFKQLR